MQPVLSVPCVVYWQTKPRGHVISSLSHLVDQGRAQGWRESRQHSSIGPQT
jgi:hypothetical protein